MKGTKGRGAAVLLAAALLFSGCGSGRAAEEESGEVLAVLGEETIYLDEAVFYVRMLQEQWEYTYYDEFGEQMWQQEASGNGETLEDVLKADVLETLTEIHLLCSRAAEYGVELTKEEQQTVAERAGRFMEDNTPEVLEAAGATQESVETYLAYNELAAKTAQQLKEEYEPSVSQEEAAVGKLTYCLFSSTGTYDAEGVHTPFTDQELVQIQAQAEAFAARAEELGDIALAGEEYSRTLIDVYFNDASDGGAHEQVAAAARSLPVGGVSGVIETEDGWYVVEHVSDYDERATQDNMEELRLQAREEYLQELETAWEKETPLELNQELWDTVRIENMLTEL